MFGFGEREIERLGPFFWWPFAFSFQLFHSRGREGYVRTRLCRKLKGKDPEPSFTMNEKKKWPATIEYLETVAVPCRAVDKDIYTHYACEIK